MKRLIQFLGALLLLAAPVFAALQVTASNEKAALGKLEASQTALVEAKKAASADAENAELATAVETADASYNEALKSAREIRDASDEGRGGELGMSIYEITNDGMDLSTKGLGKMVTKWKNKAETWVTEKGPGLAVNLLLALVILLVFKALAGISASITGKAMSSSRLRVSDLLKKFFVGIVRKLVFFAGVIIALSQIGVDTGPLLAGMGVIGFVVGFALQDTLSNFAAGIMILLYRPFDVGDFIKAAGESGVVKDLTLVSTTMSTVDNQKLIIPNSAIWGGTICNVTALATRRVDLVIGVGYGDDLDKCHEVLMDVITAHDKVLKDPAPLVRVSNLGDSAVDFVVRPWCKTSDYWDVLFDLTKAIKQRLDSEGISIPYPQRDLHLLEVPEAVKLKA